MAELSPGIPVYPTVLTLKQEALCRRLDDLRRGYKTSIPASDMFRGAIYVSRLGHRTNPDWVAQAANSLREILYPVWRKRKERVKKTALKQAGSVRADDDRAVARIDELYRRLNNLAHHGETVSIPEFENLLSEFEQLLSYALARQLDIHAEIDGFINQGPKNDEVVEDLRNLINLNQDAREYFYEKANEAWLEWLYTNRFFDFLSVGAEDPLRYSYTTPELHYLVRMAEVEPGKVVEVILGTNVSSETLNPEVIDQFLRIASKLPSNCLARLVEKIHREDWPGLMDNFNQWGMDYGRMLDTLQKSGHYKELITLSSAVLSLRDKPETDPRERVLLDESPFSIRNHSYTKVFSHLANLPQMYREEGISLLLSTLSKVVLSVGADPAEEATFAVDDVFRLGNVDIFHIQLSEQYRDTASQDIRQLLAAVKSLAQKLIGENCEDAPLVRKIYYEYIAPLPDSWLIWRLKLYLFTLCPLPLQSPLKEALFRVFETERYGDLTRGAEYKTAIQMVFPSLSDQDKRAYISKVREYFGRSDDNEYRREEGSQIASLVREYLTDAEKSGLTRDGFSIEHRVVPRPIFGEVEVGLVRHRGPVDLEQIKEIPVGIIAENLKREWSPKSLREQDTEKHFLNPLDAEGLSNLLQADISLRPSEYLAHTKGFLGDGIDLHYTYSLLSGLERFIASSTEPLSTESWGQLFDFCLATIEVVQNTPVSLHRGEERLYDSYLARWKGVLHGMASLVQKTLSAQGLALGLHLETHRAKIILVIEYLLGYPDPIPEDEEIETAPMTETVGREPPMVSNPLMLATNSIRGKGFQSLVSLANIERENFPGAAKLKLAPDVKRLYENALEIEETRALMFMFGHFLPTFFFLDRKWILEKLKHIFPSGKSSRLLFLAAWEGYLCSSLYAEIFNAPEFQKLYKRGVYLGGFHYPNQKHFQLPEDGLGAHLAMAYLHQGLVGMEGLSDAFWHCASFESHLAFVNKVGRLYVSGENSEIDELIESSPDLRERIKNIWRFLLEDYPKKELFKDFGFWISLDKGIFQVAELAELLLLTLRRSGGILEWENGLTNCLPRLASESPEETLEAVQLFLLEGRVRAKGNRMHFLLDDVWKETFSLLYNNPSTKPQTVALINALIHEGGSFFWPLKGLIS